MTRRRDRQQAEQRLHRAAGLVSGAESVIQRIGQRRRLLDAEITAWTAWTAQHTNETSRLREVDSLIAQHGRRHQPSLGREQGTHSVDRDRGIDLGL